jgi:hypothetical protein
MEKAVAALLAVQEAREAAATHSDLERAGIEDRLQRQQQQMDEVSSRWHAVETQMLERCEKQRAETEQALKVVQEFVDDLLFKPPFH